MKYKNLSTKGAQYTIITVIGKKRTYSFQSKKNAWLIENRGIGFEKIIAVLETKGAIDEVSNPNIDHYSHQKMYVVELSNYAYLVPFVKEKSNQVFLKTIFPSRKATKQYLAKKRGYNA